MRLSLNVTIGYIIPNVTMLLVTRKQIFKKIIYIQKYNKGHIFVTNLDKNMRVRGQ